MSYFLPFYPPNCPKKSKFKINEKNNWRYHHFTIMYQKSWYMLYCSWDMGCDRCNYFSFWAIFCPFNPLTVPKMKIKKNEKKIPGNIITLHKCNKNHDHMLYSSWYMVHNGYNYYFSFWAIFALLPTLTAKKIKIFKKWKKKP